ncbi:hypothetical protein HPB52_002233 [Rhipicephalus sanguineus]|uniref:BED-type domain-containing protein n=1 Tax=Rhipicephalus sanguineus TaxID=34632 RepID=A0A9D4Q477_RHISA|nr:hypothetical protein HPB52_002233 [Rhipicephalus sanguineus]
MVNGEGRAARSILDGTFFEPVEDGSNASVLKAECKLCGKVISGSRTSTSDFKVHLKRVHPNGASEYEQYLKRPRKCSSGREKANERERTDQLESTGRLDSYFGLAKNRPGQKKFDELLQNLIVKSMLPLQFVEEEAFQQFVKD